MIAGREILTLVVMPTATTAPSETTAAAAVAAAPALYVGDLHTDVADASLFELFSTVGVVSSVRVCRDSVSGCSLGYGYVNYVSEIDAIDAIGKLNHTVLCGKPIRIMWSRRNSNARNSGIGNLFVKNLSGSIDNMKLQEMFGKFGTILSAKVAIQDGKSKGYGFVQFDSQDSANAAIENLNGTTVDGMQIYVGNFIKKSERILYNPEVNYTNLYMKNLDQDITEELIELKFSEYGKIINVKIAKDEEGNSKGFGFVNFENPKSARMAMEAMNGLQLGSKTLYVARAQKKEERQQILQRAFEEKRNELLRKNMASNLYVKNIADSVDDNALLEHFSQCGTITSAKVMHDGKGISKGFGFVCYTTSEEAIKAVHTLHGCLFHGKPLFVAFAQKKEERKEQLQLHYSQISSGLAGSATPVIPTDYPPLYYSPRGVMPQITRQQDILYQPVSLRPGWRPSGFVPTSRTTFQPMPIPVMYNNQIPNTVRQQRQNRGRMNGHFLPQSGQFMSYMHHLQQPNHSLNSLMDANNQQAIYMQNGRHGDMSYVARSASSNPQGMEMLSSRLAAAPLHLQKQMLGERLFPLVQRLKPDLGAKITGMLLEMDNSELLLLLESPEAFAAKVEEAVQVLRFSRANVNGQQSLHPYNNFLSADYR